MLLLKYLQLSSIAIVLCLLLSPKAYAARWATVIADKAVVYSDIQMTSKIGFIRKGKKIRVGEKARNNGKLLPIIIEGKIAYIEIRDLQTSTRLEALQSATQRLKLQSKKVEEDNRFSIYTGTSFMFLGDSVSANDESSLLSLGFGVRGYSSEADKYSGFRGGVEYFTGTQGSFGFSYLALPGDYFYKFLKSEISEIYLYAGATLSPYAEYVFSDLLKLNGYGVGAQAGAEIIFSYKDYSLHLDGGYQFMRFMGFVINGNNSNFPDEIEFNMHGVRILGSISFKY